MKRSVNTCFFVLRKHELENTYGGEVVRIEYYENGVRKIKYVEI